jgi:hypothetical protein
MTTITDKTYTRIKYQMQKSHCERNGIEMQISEDGLCRYCGENVFEKINIVQASSELIRSCPYCSKDFVKAEEQREWFI